MTTLTWDEAIRLASPHPFALLCTMGASGQANLMGIGWWTIVSWNPPQVAISVGRGQFSRECLDEVPEFTLNLPSEEQARGAWVCGTVSGREGDKFARSGLRQVPSLEVRPPRVEGATVVFECQVVRFIETGDHVLYLADVKAISGSPEKPRHLYSIHYHRLVSLDGSRLDPLPVDAGGT
ncbi:MAG TPA: flavin reductase family protein [Myxococcota bacterium]|nr:flavin reductase family protein [Myxococcota bacterium]HQK51769.1 flavin reductase family protein [Myxococcota bacterium]